MKSFNLGKTTKKLLQQGKDYSFISKMLGKTPEECIEAYHSYIGYTPTFKSSDNLEELILQKRKLHIYGESGVGKSYLVKKFAEELELRVFVSYARSEEELVRDFGDFPFQEGDNIFVLEGDGFYWKKYGLIKRYIDNSKVSFIVITNKKETPTKNITKLLKQIKIYPPTKTDVAKWVKSIFQLSKPELVNEIYDKDWRKVMRNFLYGTKEDFKINKKETIDARTFVYKLLKGNATPEDFDKCIHPLSFILNWLGWNTPNFYRGERLKRNMEIVSFVDANKYSLGKYYLQHYLLEFLPTSAKAQLYFPPFKRNKETIVEEKNYEVSKYKKRNVSKPTKKESKSIKDDIGEFLLEGDSLLI